MSEFNYLTGRKELFDNAPEEALVVLEHDDGRLFFAIAHDMGARYWNEDGSAGSKIGLIALFNKTRVVASRAVLHGGVAAAAPAPETSAPKSRLDRMQQAQDGLKKAVSQPAPVKPKPEPKPAPVKLESPVITPKVKPEPAPSARLNHAVDDGHGLGNYRAAIAESPTHVPTEGFVSMFELSRQQVPKGVRAVTLYRNGSLSLSSSLFEVGDMVDAQIDVARSLIRIGKVKTGGRPLKKTRVLPASRLLPIVGIPEKDKSVRIVLTEQDGWFVGTFTKAEGGK